MDTQQLKEIERYVIGTMGVVLLVMWLLVKWALKKSKELEAEEERAAHLRKEDITPPNSPISRDQ
jgi:hypothetical protein